MIKRLNGLLSRNAVDKVMLLGIALAVLAADQVTKTWVRTNIPLGQSRHVLGAFFSVSHIANTGAAFGLFPGQGTLFMIIAMLVIVLIVVYYRQLPMEQWALKVSLGLQLGGALGNLADRILLGYVVDFIDFGFWPVFNLADCAVVGGVIILAYQVLNEEEPEEDRPHHEAMEW